MKNSFPDGPRSLKEKEAVERRQKTLSRAKHMKPLCWFVKKLRVRTKKCIPMFDPFDGGVNARILFLFESPGSKAVESGFVSRDNPDGSAANFFELSKKADINREDCISWNIVPWFIGGEGCRIRRPVARDIEKGCQCLPSLLRLLRKVRIIVLAGVSSQKAEAFVLNSVNGKNIIILKMNHTSPQFVNRNNRNRNLLLGQLENVAVAFRIFQKEGAGRKK